MKILSIDYNQKILLDDEDYERVSSFMWSINNRNRKTALLANINGKITTIGRFILGYDGPNEVDHIDRDLYNNQKCNLRIVTSTENKGNRTKQSNNTSGYKGVTWDKSKQKWQVRVSHQFIGRYSSLIEAAKAYDKAAFKYFGYTVKLNFE